ncbi:hypothetical protein DDF84_006725 [Cupriavidus metallidurans]|uniref:Uncharacterized protein n=1 Tax=Cupriavidus metallidurans TaxID=119219 RepID=A0A482IMQ7_9BURK|nr:hypothetical protein DDF84_006725 [Cupriavidus metallidurans]
MRIDRERNNNDSYLIDQAWQCVDGLAGWLKRRSTPAMRRGLGTTGSGAADGVRHQQPDTGRRGLRSRFKKILASLRGLAVLLVLSAAPRLARTASLHFETAS